MASRDYLGEQTQPDRRERVVVPEWSRNPAGAIIVAGVIFGLMGVTSLALDVGRPFAKFMTYGYFARSDAEVAHDTPRWWEPIATGKVIYGDEVDTINGLPFTPHVREEFDQAYRLGVPVVLTLRRIGEGLPITLSFRLDLFTIAEYLDVALPELLVGMVFWLLAVIVLRARPDSTMNQVFAMLAACITIHRLTAITSVITDESLIVNLPKLGHLMALARSGLPLITHGGWEHELVEGGDQELGNPLRIRAALQEGVRVIVAHCAMQGDFLDTDRGPGRTPRPSFELFARLMDSREYVDLLYGDLSAVTIGGRQPGALRRLLTSESWQPRLVNGSDYPGPGIVPVMSLKTLVDEGVLAAEEVGRLAHIQHHNPMLFDFAVKRRIAWRGGFWPASAFETQRLFRAG